MRKFNAYRLDDWPRRKSGEIIFSSTEEAIYFAHISHNRLVDYHLLEKWRKNALQNCRAEKDKQPINYNRWMDFAVRAQFCREAMEEIERLNQEDL